MTDEEREILYKMWDAFQPSPLSFPLKYSIKIAAICGIAGIVIGIAATFIALDAKADIRQITSYIKNK